jgi:transcriptional regulator with XRE-family HTH domain
MPLPSISKLFGSAVRNRRLSAGLSQELLAERASLHPTYISMVERGARNATLGAAARIAAALKISLPKLLEEAERQPRPKGRTQAHSRTRGVTSGAKAERPSRTS